MFDTRVLQAEAAFVRKLIRRGKTVLGCRERAIDSDGTGACFAEACGRRATRDCPDRNAGLDAVEAAP
jgi:hypothetical protein